MRTKPYTAIGIKRVPCARCGKPSHAQRNIGSLGKTFHGICKACDTDLNALVLDWLQYPNRHRLLNDYVFLGEEE